MMAEFCQVAFSLLLIFLVWLVDRVIIKKQPLIKQKEQATFPETVLAIDKEPSMLWKDEVPILCKQENKSPGTRAYVQGIARALAIGVPQEHSSYFSPKVGLIFQVEDTHQHSKVKAEFLKDKSEQHS